MTGHRTKKIPTEAGRRSWRWPSVLPAVEALGVVLEDALCSLAFVFPAIRSSLAMTTAFAPGLSVRALLLGNLAPAVGVHGTPLSLATLLLLAVLATLLVTTLGVPALL